MIEQGTKPVNRYLPPRARDAHETGPVNLAELAEPEVPGFLGWLDRTLERIG